MKYKIDFGGVTEDNLTDAVNESLSNSVTCNKDYIPTIGEIKIALGDYGTVVLTIGSIVTIVLYSLFAEQVYYTYTTCHKVFRRHIIWITSVYPFMTLMSVISLAMPRAEGICTAVKVTYMSIGISHFTDLTTGMYGSERAMLAYLEGSHLNLQVGPCCCVCPCLPSPPVNKTRVRIVRWLLWQMPYTQALYFVINLLWTISYSESDGTIDPNESFLWLSTLNIASFSGGVFALQIMAAAGTIPLEEYNYGKKAFSVKTLVLVTKMQGFIFDILAYYNVFPCITPYISPRTYKQTVENSIYLLEMIILGPYTYWQYHNEAFMTANPKEPRLSTFGIMPKEVNTISKTIQPGAAGDTNSHQKDPKGPHEDHSAYVDLSSIVTSQNNISNNAMVTDPPRRIINEFGIRENMI